MQEIWKPIKDFPNYEVSNFGQVRSLRNNYRNLRKIPKILKRGLDSWKYFQIKLYDRDMINGGRTAKIHRLVAETFLGSCPEGKEVNHKDGNKTNNHVDNLEYVTKSENVMHTFKLELHDSAKLSKEDVKDIRCIYKTGRYAQYEIGKMFLVNQSTIHDIISNHSWKHVVE